MERLVIVRYQAKPERAAENEALSAKVFEELDARKPEGIMYSVFRNGDEFIHVLINTRAADSSPVVGLPAFQSYMQSVAERTNGEIHQERLDLKLLHGYGLK